MKLLVCVSQTPDTTTKIKFSGDDTQLDANGVQFIMNPYDEWYALVRAIELKEKFGGTVTIIHVGPAANEATMRKGLAIGADSAIRIDGEASSALFVAKQIAEHAKAENYDIIFFGKETIDYNGSEVPAMVSELLDLPFVSYASEMDMNGNVATLQRDIEGGKEVLEVATPFVVSAAKGMAEQRIPNMKGIMNSKRIAIQVVAPVAATEGVKVAKFEYPPVKTGCKYVSPDNMDELVSLLHHDAKVI